MVRSSNISKIIKQSYFVICLNYHTTSFKNKKVSCPNFDIPAKDVCCHYIYYLYLYLFVFYFLQEKNWFDVFIQKWGDVHFFTFFVPISRPGFSPSSLFELSVHN
jgi:hypothetical protein